MKLVYLDGKVPAIFFPPGEVAKKGTCQFASKKCLKECPSQKSTILTKVYKEFKAKKPIILAGGIIETMDTLHYGEVLQWFSSGDCESEMEEKILKVIKFISMAGIIQCGFTRNVSFWKKTKKIPNVNLVITVESMRIAKERFLDTIVAIPNYKTGVVNLHYIIKGDPVRVRRSGGCGGSWWEESPNARPTTTRPLITEPDCTMCASQKKGCFYIPE